MAQIDVYYTCNLSTRCIHGDNEAEIITDAPKDNHGRGEMFSPTDLIAAALGSCVLTLMGIAASKLKVDISGARARVEKEMISQPKRRIGKIIVKVNCPQNFTEEVKEKLERAGRECPVHHSLHPDMQQEIQFIWGSP